MKKWVYFYSRRSDIRQWHFLLTQKYSLSSYSKFWQAIFWLSAVKELVVRAVIQALTNCFCCKEKRIYVKKDIYRERVSKTRLEVNGTVKSFLADLIQQKRQEKTMKREELQKKTKKQKEQKINPATTDAWKNVERFSTDCDLESKTICAKD